MKRFLIIAASIGLCSTLLTGCDAINTAKQAANLFDKPTAQHTVIVAGYGTKVKGNATYQNYIKAVATYVNNPANKVNSVVFSGSYSDSKDTSEAEAMNAYFNSVVDVKQLQSSGVKVYKEECAIVSWQNISYSQELLTKAKITPTQVTLFGDQDRADKLKAFAIYEFNLADGVPHNVTEAVSRSINTTTVDFQGFNFGDSVHSEAERQVAFAAEALGAYDTKIGNDILRKRLDMWTTQYGFNVADNLVKKGCTQYSGF